MQKPHGLCSSLEGLFAKVLCLNASYKFQPFLLMPPKVLEKEKVE